MLFSIAAALRGADEARTQTVDPAATKPIGRSQTAATGNHQLARINRADGCEIAGIETKGFDVNHSGVKGCVRSEKRSH